VAERSLHNVSLLEGDAAALGFERRFDAAVGRYVLQFQKDPAALLRSVAAHVRSGGLVAFHELDWDGLRSVPPVPTYDRCCRLGREVMRSAAETQMGAKLFPTFLAAGLSAPTLIVEGLAGVADPLRLVADFTATLATKIEQRGLATAAELDSDALFARMLSEAQATGSFAIAHFQFGAWSRIGDERRGGVRVVG
jgi:SAM-dependent methyltransferase